MHKKYIIGFIVFAAFICIWAFAKTDIGTQIKQSMDMQNQNTQQNINADIAITPIEHASMVLGWNNKVLYTDPVGAEKFAEKPEPDLILLTDIHGDHLNAATLQAVSKPTTVIVAPKAVVDLLPKDIPGTVVTLNNGESTNQQSFVIQAIPMYNLPESATALHTKGRGNGYVVEAAGKRVYISGDTAGIPEMRALQNIDLAFVCMNPPYTMSVEEAADAVLAFGPKEVVPYHYRGPDGLSDTGAFKALVNAGNPDIVVNLINFYPN